MAVLRAMALIPKRLDRMEGPSTSFWGVRAVWRLGLLTIPRWRQFRRPTGRWYWTSTETGWTLSSSTEMAWRWTILRSSKPVCCPTLRLPRHKHRHRRPRRPLRPRQRPPQRLLQHLLPRQQRPHVDSDADKYAFSDDDSNRSAHTYGLAHSHHHCHTQPCSSALSAHPNQDGVIATTRYYPAPEGAGMCVVSNHMERLLLLRGQRRYTPADSGVGARPYACLRGDSKSLTPTNLRGTKTFHKMT